MPGETRAVLVEDVLTTGGSLAAAHAKLRQAGADVPLCLVAICRADRQQLWQMCGPQGIAVYTLFQARGHELHPGGVAYLPDFLA